MSVCKQTPRKNVQLVNLPSENTAKMFKISKVLSMCGARNAGSQNGWNLMSFRDVYRKTVKALLRPIFYGDNFMVILVVTN